MNNTNKISLVIFGYSETLLLAILVKSKTVKVKKFNFLRDVNEDQFFKVISSFISYNFICNNIYFSCGPGGFTIIRKIISFVKALQLSNYSRIRFIGLNHLFINAYYLIHNNKIKEQEYILSILNYSNDHFVQLFKRKKSSLFSLDCLSDVNNIKVDLIDTFLQPFNISLDITRLVYLGPTISNLSILKNVTFVNEVKILETIVQISILVENYKSGVMHYKGLIEDNFRPIYGKPPSTN